MREPTKYIQQGFRCLEIGVWKGDYSNEILQRKPSELHLVDPWKFQPEFSSKWYGGKIAKQQNDMDNIYNSVVKRFMGKPVHIHRGFSSNLYNEFEDSYFDWVYIDGNHEYDYVLDDLKNYLPKVKSGGFLCGDDYVWKNDNNELTVKNAVLEFIKKTNLHLEVYGNQFIIHIK